MKFSGKRLCVLVESLGRRAKNSRQARPQCALEGAVRNRGDLIELLRDEPVTRPHRKAKALPPGQICATA
jgi:hypothetical protein